MPGIIYICIFGIKHGWEECVTSHPYTLHVGSKPSIAGRPLSLQCTSTIVLLLFISIVRICKNQTLKFFLCFDFAQQCCFLHCQTWKSRIKWQHATHCHFQVKESVCRGFLTRQLQTTGNCGFNNWTAWKNCWRGTAAGSDCQFVGESHCALSANKSCRLQTGTTVYDIDKDSLMLCSPGNRHFRMVMSFQTLIGTKSFTKICAIDNLKRRL